MHNSPYLYITYTVYITVPCTLNTQDKKVQHTKAFADICPLHQLRRRSHVVGDVGHHHSLTQRLQHHWDVLTDEADRCR